MPATWLKPLQKAPAPSGAFAHPADAGADAPVARLEVRPHRSLTARGFVTFMGATLAMVAVPLLAVLGTPVLWALLPFVGMALWGLWAAIGRNQRDAAALTETLTFWPDRVELIRREPKGAVRRWEANPHWVRLRLYSGTDPVEHYLTLSGGGREVELGAFLSPDERVALHADLVGAFAALRGRAPA